MVESGEREPLIEDVIQEGVPVGFAEFSLDVSGVRPWMVDQGDGSHALGFNFADTKVIDRIREEFPKKHLALIKAILRGERIGWVRPVVGGVVGIAALTSLVIYEKNVRHGMDFKNFLERIGFADKDKVE